MTDITPSGGLAPDHSHPTGDRHENAYNLNWTKQHVNLLEVSEVDYGGSLPRAHFIANISAKYTFLSQRVRIRLNQRYFNDDVLREIRKVPGYEEATAAPYSTFRRRSSDNVGTWLDFDTGFSTYSHRKQILEKKKEKNGTLDDNEERELAFLTEYHSLVEGVYTIVDWGNVARNYQTANKGLVITKNNFAETFRQLVTDNTDYLDKWTRYYFDIPKIDSPQFLEKRNELTQRYLDGPYHSGVDTGTGNPKKQDEWTRWPFSQVTGDYINDEFIIGNIQSAAGSYETHGRLDKIYEVESTNGAKINYIGAAKIKDGIKAALLACLCVRKLNVVLKVNNNGSPRTVGEITKHAMLSAEPTIRANAMNTDMQDRLRIKKGDVISANRLKVALDELAEHIETITDTVYNAEVFSNITFCHSSCHSNYGARGRR